MAWGRLRLVLVFLYAQATNRRLTDVISATFQVACELIPERGVAFHRDDQVVPALNLRRAPLHVGRLPTLQGHPPAITQITVLEVNDHLPRRQVLDLQLNPVAPAIALRPNRQVRRPTAGAALESPEESIGTVDGQVVTRIRDRPRIGQRFARLNRVGAGRRGIVARANLEYGGSVPCVQEIDPERAVALNAARRLQGVGERPRQSNA